MVIPVIGLTYRAPSYLKKSLDSIISTASEELEITVVDSHSDRSPEIKEILQEYLAAGKIKRFLTCNENCKGYGFQAGFCMASPDNDFTVLTDLDVVVPSGADWVADLRKSMEDTVLSCFALDMTNYVPPNSGHLDSPDGLSYWLMGIKTWCYNELSFRSKNRFMNTLDSNLVHAARYCGKVRRIDSIRLIHLAWNLWKDDPQYWDDKVKGIDWFDWFSKKLEFEVYA